LTPDEETPMHVDRVAGSAGLAESDYCPFDIVHDADQFGLTAVAVETAYGAIVSRVSKERSADTATLYIHGVGADWSTWTPLVQAAARGKLEAHDEIFINLPGFGDSENKLGKLKIADVGEMALSVASSLGYKSVRIVGHSMGGFLTLDMASRHSEQIESIHLVAGPYFSILTTIQNPLAGLRYSPKSAVAFGTQYLLSLAGSGGVTLAKGVYRLGAGRGVLCPVASHPFELKQSIVRALFYEQNPRGLIETAANGPGYDADRQWAKIACPIWAVFGDKDWLVPPHDMRRFLRCQPSAACTTLKDSSHMMHVERPFDVLKALALWDS
jgi:pimeloyl-ACP methyl ester carboxylesterase